MLFGILQCVGIFLVVGYGTTIFIESIHKINISAGQTLMFAIGVLLIVIRYINFC